MSKAKATNKGTCQVCGCVQKLPGGRLSTHGYTVQWGFFSGVCHGTNNKPFEESKDMIEDAIKRAQRQAENIRKEQDELRAPVPAGTSKAWINVYFPCTSRGGIKSHYRFVELDVYLKKSTLLSDGSKYTTFYHAPCRETSAHDMGEHNRRIGGYMSHFKTIEEACQAANSVKAESLNKVLAEIATYIKWQRERIHNWAPRPLLKL